MNVFEKHFVLNNHHLNFSTDVTLQYPISCLNATEFAWLQTTPTLLADKDNVVSAIVKKWVLSTPGHTELLKSTSNYETLDNQIFRSEIKLGQYVFDIPTVANSIGSTAIDVSNQLLNLKVRIICRVVCGCHTQVCFEGYLLYSLLTSYLYIISSKKYHFYLIFCWAS